MTYYLSLKGLISVLLALTTFLVLDISATQTPATSTLSRFSIGGAYAASVNPPTYNANASCSNNQFFDTGLLKCRSCDSASNFMPNNTTDIDFECICAEGYVQTISGNAYTCQDCGTSGKAVDRTRSICMGCDSNTTLGYNSTKRDCECPANHVLVERDSLGNLLVDKKCVSCGTNAVVDPSDSLYKCKKCPDPRMTVNAAGQCDCVTAPYDEMHNSRVCVYKSGSATIKASYSLQSASTITYHDVQERLNGPYSSETVRSAWLFDQFLPSAIQCKVFSEMKACQTLANMCALQLYDMTTEACRLYSSILDSLPPSSDANSGFAGWMAGLPWLYYKDDSSKVLSSMDIASKVSFVLGSANTITRLPLILSMYSVNGTWLGFKEVTTELQTCPDDPSATYIFSKFGTNYEKKCNFNIQAFLDKGDPVLYDPYFLDGTTLYPIPVQIVEGEITSTSLYRRFFLHDTITGKKMITDAADDNSIPDVIRFAKSVELTTTIQKENPARIYPPVLKVTYASRKTLLMTPKRLSDMEVPTSTSAVTSLYAPEVKFVVTYTMSISAFWTASLVIMIILVVMAVISSCVKCFRYNRQRGSVGQAMPGATTLDFTFLIRIFVFLSSSIANSLFVVLLGSCFGWFIFYKLQNTVYILLPTTANNYRNLVPYVVVLVLAFVGKLIEVIDHLVQQSRIDIFFIDWEKTRGKVITGKSAAGANVVGTKEKNVPISIWRTVFVSNEWNKLQRSNRIINITLMLLWLLVMLEGFNLINKLASQQPRSSDDTYIERIKTHPVLRFAVTSFLWLVGAFAQSIFLRGFWYRFVRADPLDLFIDVCSLAKISVFILLDKMHYGYYIHGEGVFAHADADMAELNENLRREQNDAKPQRGLINGSDIQTFEIYVTPGFRAEFNKRLSIPIQEEKLAVETQAQQIAQQQQPNEPMRFFNIIIPRLWKRQVPTPRLISAYNDLNNYLKQFINTMRGKPGQVMIKDLFHRWGIPPDVFTMRQDLFFNDPQYKFKRVLLRGIEYDLLMLSILAYGLIDLATQNTFVSVFVVYVLNWLVERVRAYFGQINIVNKTLLDERFFL